MFERLNGDPSYWIDIRVPIPSVLKVGDLLRLGSHLLFSLYSPWFTIGMLEDLCKPPTRTPSSRSIDHADSGHAAQAIHAGRVLHFWLDL